MRITVGRLRRMIAEEVKRSLNENEHDLDGMYNYLSIMYADGPPFPRKQVNTTQDNLVYLSSLREKQQDVPQDLLDDLSKDFETYSDLFLDIGETYEGSEDEEGYTEVCALGEKLKNYVEDPSKIDSETFEMFKYAIQAMLSRHGQW